ncbi:hypothetical protein QTP88_005584 [Uroleucon formosanum]
MSILMYLHNIVKIADDLTHVTTYLKINYLFCQLVSLLCMFKMSIVYTVFTIHALISYDLIFNKRTTDIRLNVMKVVDREGHDGKSCLASYSPDYNIGFPIQIKKFRFPDPGSSSKAK